MLETNLIAQAIHVAELEQAFTDDRFDIPFAVQGHRPDSADLAVGHVQGAAVAGQTARLGEASLRQRSVTDVFPPVAGIWRQETLIQIERPDLVMPCHGDVECVAVQADVPRAVQADAESFPAPAAVLSLFAVASDRLHP